MPTGVADLERVPGDGAFLGDGQVPAGLEECRQLVALTGLGFQQRQSCVRKTAYKAIYKSYYCKQRSAG